MNRLLILLICTFINTNLFSQQLPVQEVGACGENIDYVVLNNTDSPYIFWINRDIIDQTNPIDDSEILGRFRQYTHYKPDPVPSNWLTLGTWLTDGNVVHHSDYAYQYQLGIDYIHRLMPGEYLIVKIDGDEERREFYRNRFASMKESLYYVRIEDPFINPDSILIIDNSPKTELMERIRGSGH
ncbi:MAG: hypothetical protein K2M07_05105 [Muribaculaceae bacterium]|nr:hypothetical protein [Muribaculaceae bacterium]